MMSPGLEIPQQFKLSFRNILSFALGPLYAILWFTSKGLDNIKDMSAGTMFTFVLLDFRCQHLPCRFVRLVFYSPSNPSSGV